MGRRRPVDFVGWRLYRRALVVPVLALLVLLVTSFRADVPVQGALPPTLANEHAAKLLTDAEQFRGLFRERQPGSPGSVDSAQWMLERFRDLGLQAKTVTATTIDPATGSSVGLVNVEGTLPGRTRELVVLHAHRDTAADGRGGDAAGQVALLSLAAELASTRDLRRTYLFVSTDGATLNGGGARALAERLSTRGAVVAVIGVDRLGAGETLRVDAAPSGGYAPPLGLVRAATGAVAAEGGDPSIGGLTAQVARLAAPVTLREHGQLLQLGLPALTITAGDDQIRRSGDRAAEAAQVGAGVRSIQRLLGTLEQVDQLQSAGRTWIATERRVYRGWALKIFIATLLVPVWIAAVDMLVRHRRGWNLAAAVGTAARAMLAGVTAVGGLWLLGAVGLLPGGGDRPPNPGSLDDVRAFGLVVWILVAVAAWLLARGPDWRRQRQESRRHAIGPDTPELVVTLVALVVVSVLALAVSPYAVLFVAPALHLWMCIPSWRIVFSPARATVVWVAGFVGPLLSLVAVATRSDTGAGTAWYALQLVQSRTVPPMLGLLMGAGGGLLLLLFVASRGRVAHPALPLLRARWTAVRDGQVGVEALVPGAVRGAVGRLREEAVRLRVPGAAGRTAGRSVAASRSRRARAGVEPETPTASSAAERARRRAHERAAASASRRRVKSR